jgi:uncharacterized membrane protein YhaH (DUF805 family)
MVGADTAAASTLATVVAIAPGMAMAVDRTRQVDSTAVLVVVHIVAAVVAAITLLAVSTAALVVVHIVAVAVAAITLLAVSTAASAVDRAEASRDMAGSAVATVAGIVDLSRSCRQA